ncbi:atrial natriuretic peptide receptor 1-like isoform X4 [Mya arenaria]|uniref:atrial natriuretic peptide receptor 1-like isoform X4 n=1 Tax=Mya arenaria TaxID=6604 RepID=UPI0022E8C169|nr:atrial natriuretic peptide receptor 1-like isoform X4 [Mya arenaria]
MMIYLSPWIYHLVPLMLIWDRRITVRLCTFVTFVGSIVGVTHGRILTIGLLVPHSGSRSVGTEAEIVIGMAIEKVNAADDLMNLRAHNITFEFQRADTHCDIGQGLYELVQMNNVADAFIGPACDSVCLPAGLLAAKWDKPMISYSCSSSVLNNHDHFRTFARTTAIYTDMTFFILDFLEFYGWDHVVIVEGPESVWRETAGFFQSTFERAGVVTELLSISSNEDHYVIEKNLKHSVQEGKVFILCTYGLDTLYVMCAAETAGLLDGNHVFIAIDFAYMTTFKSAADRPCTLPKDLEGMLDVTIQLDEEYDGYKTFVQELNLRTSEIHGVEIGIHMGMLYDAVYLYALGLDKTLELGLDERNGSQIIDQLLLHSFQGITGEVRINVNGTRNANFTMHNVFMGTYRPVAHGNTSRGGLYFDEDAMIYWHGGSTTPPLGRPVCGWNGELCYEEEDKYTVVLTAMSVAVLIILTMASVFGAYLYRRRKHNEQMESMAWKVAFDDLDFKVKNKGSAYGSVGTFMSKRSRSHDTLNMGKTTRVNSMDSAISSGQVFTKVASYDGKLVAVKHINKPYVAVTAALKREMNEIRQLNHRNINPLVGACVEPLKVCLLAVYCPKGSLQDVLENDNIKLDQIFKVAFATDIAKGMSYLHSSAVRSHGHLKSSNVFIDPHWTCRIGDIAMPVFRDAERPPSSGELREHYQQLWTAPELLRDPSRPARGSPKGDVYSYGIILQEIMLRTGPFGNNNFDPEDILERLIEKQTPPFRPEVPPLEGISEIDDVMRMCWEEVPLFRPSFDSVLESLKKFNNGKTTNLVDQMIHMMERYADHLEELVNNRTEELEIEQKRTEELLCRMLPRSIANDLKVGKIIAPETYDCVTVFFSDIVGFTALSSESTPMEVVNFLNDLYTCFDTIIEDYDVYKVETIGDAYMVVSGLPQRNSDRHAGEIATMALDLLSSVTTFRIRHRPDRQLQMRVGIHSGSVCAGVVGLSMPRYCLFGDTVNYASRMESSSLALRIHVSPETKHILDKLGGYHFHCRGLVMMKGKGEVKTYFLLSKEGFSKPLPDLALAAPVEEHEFK